MISRWDGDKHIYYIFIYNIIYLSKFYQMGTLINLGMEKISNREQLDRIL